ncbi:MAG: hypothetical protein VX248_03885 [Pseudomonadota bacterium]|uniref:Argininosuccinate lyase n=1 Tax=Thalassococcus halodurans TaxID=373675 RepID=A0A1H5Z0K9_9RHOB|nr:MULTISPECIES: hypothetical protein [Thalassococcus]MBO6865894.1 hypothetical protein [Thalassococcus sp.]MEE3359065.1 hypothetical protein [Pseudomonadota bacterium]SEG29570.1 hypothetical protein SAMN04488045_2346 [Thalassococcus halodurans]
MKQIALFLALLTLASCGADGDPIRPNYNANVSVGTGGVKTNVGVSVSKGPVTVGVGL